LARKRTIDPDLWTDDRVQRLPSPLAILLYIGTISQADDEGRLEWSARQLLARVFPLRDDVKQRDVEAAMSAIAAELVHVYEIGSRAYAWHPEWKKFQYVNRPTKSKLPDPPRGPSLFESVSSPVEPHASLSASVSPHVPSVSVSVSVSDKLAPLAARDVLSPGLQFGKWFFSAGSEAGAIPSHLAVDPGPLGFAYRHHEASDALVAAHGDDECRRRAANLFARKTRTDADKLQLDATPSTLRDRWDWFDQAERERPGRRGAPYDRTDISGGTGYAEIIAGREERIEC
jgi:hypothetical protein